MAIRDEDENVYSLRSELPQTGDLLSGYLGVVQVLRDERVEHAVDPAVAARVRLPLHAFADEPRALRVPLRALVEAVDLQLDPMEAELADQVVLQQAGGVVGEPAAAEAGMHGEPAHVRDPAAAVAELPAHRAGGLAVELDDEETAALRLLGDLLGDPVPVVGAGSGEEGAHVLVGVELDQELEVALAGGADRDGHGRTGTAVPRRSLTAPDASATPPRISARPPSVASVSSSSRISAP